MGIKHFLPYFIAANIWGDFIVAANQIDFKLVDKWIIWFIKIEYDKVINIKSKISNNVDMNKKD